MEQLVARGQLHHLGLRLEAPWTAAEEVSYRANMDFLKKRDTPHERTARELTLKALLAKTWRQALAGCLSADTSCIHCYLTLQIGRAHV